MIRGQEIYLIGQTNIKEMLLACTAPVLEIANPIF